MSNSLDKIPERMRGGLARYLIWGTRPGGFLFAVLTNNLRDAVACADKENETLLAAHVRVLHALAPGDSWGDRITVAGWLGASHDALFPPSHPLREWLTK